MRGERFASASSSNATMLLPRFAGRLGEGDATLDEETSDLVNHRRVALYQPIAHPVESLQVELCVGS